MLSKLRENKKTAELIKTANLLFNSFEPYYMWDYIARWFEECCRFVKMSSDGQIKFYKASWLSFYLCRKKELKLLCFIQTSTGLLNCKTTLQHLAHFNSFGSICV